MTTYRVTYSTKASADVQSSTTITVTMGITSGVVDAVACADAQMAIVWPDWLRELHYVSAVVPAGPES